MIKPGTICYLIHMWGAQSVWEGRVVTALGDADHGKVRVDAEWLRQYLQPPFQIPPFYLLPINDPDEPVTTRTPEELTA